MNIQQQLEDYNRQYANTYIQCVGNNNIKYPFSVEAITYSNKDKQFSCKGYCANDEKTWVPSTLPFTTSNFCLTHPTYGAINVDDTVMYIERVPRRQWRLGISSDFFQMHNLFFDEETYITNGLNAQTQWISIYMHWFNNKYPSFQSCYDLVTNGKCLGRAFTNKFSMGNKFNNDLPVLFYKTYQVGVVTSTQALLHSSASHLIDELSQYTTVRLQ